MNKRFFGLIGILLLSCILFTNVYAKNVVSAGDTIVEEGEYDFTRFVAGNKVTNKAIVKGLSFVAGNEVTIEGKSEYGFYAGNILTINEEVEKDAFIAGNSITLDKDAIFNRDVYVAGSTILIKTNIARDLRIGASSVDLRGVTIGGDAYIAAEEIILDAETTITGKLTYFEDTKITGLENASVGSVKINKSKDVYVEYSPMQRVTRFLERCLAALIVMLVLFYLLPNAKEKLDNTEISANNVFKMVGIGLVLLIVSPIIIIIALLTGILTPLALIMGAIFVISIYLTSLVVAYLIGKLISTKLFKTDSVYLELALGIIIVRLLGYIPYLGGLLIFIILLCGLGLIFKYIKARQN